MTAAQIRIPDMSGRTVAVLGLARSGLSAARTLMASGAAVWAWDDSAAKRDEAKAADIPLVDLQDCDWMKPVALVLSPGIPHSFPKPHPVAALATARRCPIIGDIELMARAKSGARFIGITGTNGKSTTTALVHHILESAGIPSRMGGNIGLPILGQEPLTPNGAGVGVYVLELSSYQIDLTHSLEAEIATLINLSPDHLDRYDGFEGYVASKLRLFAMQRADQHAVFGCGDPRTLAAARKVAGRRGKGQVHVVDPARLEGQHDWPSLQGPHNLQNAAIAVEIARLLDVEEAQWRPALASFAGLEHRMERVAEHRGVLFVNDSKATNPASTAPALAAYPRIHWILGGLPKGDDLDDCLPHIGNVAAAYTIGEAGPMFARLLEPFVPVRRSEMLCEAVRQAMTAARPGEVVMLSPACASFDQFRDFEARGDAFRDIVAALIAETAPAAFGAAR